MSNKAKLYPPRDSSNSLKKANNLSDVANANTSLNNILPDQTSNAGKFLKTDGTDASWATGGGGGDAPDVTYTPTTNTDWFGTPPTNAQEALDNLAALNKNDGPDVYKVGPGRTFTSIQDAIDQAVTDGHTSADQFPAIVLIYPKEGSYDEDITLKIGVNIMGFLDGKNPSVLCTGTWTGGADYDGNFGHSAITISNLIFSHGDGDQIHLTGADAGSIRFNNCIIRKIDGHESQILLDGDNNFELYLDNCEFNNTAPNSDGYCIEAQSGTVNSYSKIRVYVGSHRVLYAGNQTQIEVQLDSSSSGDYIVYADGGSQVILAHCIMINNGTNSNGIYVANNGNGAAFVFCSDTIIGLFGGSAGAMITGDSGGQIAYAKLTFLAFGPYSVGLDPVLSAQPLDVLLGNVLDPPAATITNEVYTTISPLNLEDEFSFTNEQARPLGGGSAANILTATPASGDYLVKFSGLLQSGNLGGRAEMGIFKGTTDLINGSRMLAKFSDQSGGLDATATFIALYNGSTPDADQAVGSATGTLVGDEASVSGGCLTGLDSNDSPTAHHGGATYNAASNADFTQTGTVRLVYIPHWSGAPSAAFLNLFEVTNGPFAGENRIHAFIGSSGQIELIVIDKDGNLVLFDSGFTPTWVAGQRYEIEFNFDFTSGDVYIFLDGALGKHWTGVTCLRDTTIGFLGVMSSDSDNSPADGQMDSIYIWDTVKHTSAFESEAATRMGMDLGDVVPVQAMAKVTLDGSTAISVKRKCSGQSSLLTGTLELIKVG